MKILTDNAKTELVSLVETTYGEAILTMQRDEEEKELVIANTGLSEVVLLHGQSWVDTRTI